MKKTYITPNTEVLIVDTTQLLTESCGNEGSIDDIKWETEEEKALFEDIWDSTFD